MGRARQALLTLATALAASGSIDCGKEAAAPCIAVVNEPVTDEMLALPILGELTEGRRASSVGWGCNEGYGDVEYEAKLGPFTARYTTLAYKGLPITSGNANPLFLSSPRCRGSEVTFQMTYGTVRVRRDTKRDLYIVTNGAGPSSGEPPGGEKAGALLIRMTTPKR